MELLNLVLVDDEAILLQGLLETYNWEEMGFTVVGTARNGEEAIRVISEKKPHVVLSDIRMKQISGLMVMEEIMKQDPSVVFIFLSAYRDFEYARKACDLGAFSYLLKPVEDELLYETMESARKACLEQIRNEEKQEHWERILKSGSANFVQVVIQRYLENRIDYEKMEEVFSVLGEVDANDMFIAVCADIDLSYKITNQLEYEAARFSMVEHLDQVMKDRFFIWQFDNNEKHHLILVKTKDTASVHEVKAILEQAKHTLNSPVIASISKPYKGIGGLKKSYEEAVGLFYYANASGASAFTADIEIEDGVAQRYAGEEEMMIVNAVRKNDQAELKEAMIQFVYSLPKDKELQGQYLHRMMLQAEFAARESYGLTEEINGAFRSYYQNLQSLEVSRSVDVCYKILENLIRERKRCIDNKETDYFSEYISVAVAYIEEHLHDEGLSIVEVANYIYLNPVYFGRVFKHTFNMTFKKYLLQQRMEQSKKLLESGKCSISAICEKVGISNPSYFSHLFKQYTGMLPSEYKKEYEG